MTSFLRIRYAYSTDPNLLMPPPESHLILSEYEKEILIKWIKKGAEHKPHWAFVAPEKAELPETENSDWGENEIDPTGIPHRAAKVGFFWMTGC